MIAGIAGVAALVAAAVAWWGPSRRPADAELAPPVPAAVEARAIPVAVAAPLEGGFGRATTQPGSVHAFEWAELHARASGYLAELAVDLGDPVTRGQVLARIDAPDLLRDADRARAAVGQAEAEVAQADARIEAAEADREVAAAAIREARARVPEATARLQFREIQYRRVHRLESRGAAQAEMLDEAARQLETARAAEDAARMAVLTAEARLAAAGAEVARAEADRLAAEAGVEVARAELARAEVLVADTRIVAPFDGVVTRRHAHRGAFIRSAVEGDQTPLLTVARTDRMRMVVQVPERQVPYVDVGDPAEVRVDALAGRAFPASVARLAGAQDPSTRTMRVEVDLPNPKGVLRPGMFGRVSIRLEPPGPNLRVPATSLVGRSEDGTGQVFVVRDGRAHLTPVSVVADDGVEVEIGAGLDPSDAVIVGHAGAVRDGVPVSVAEPALADNARRAGRREPPDPDSAPG